MGPIIEISHRTADGGKSHSIKVPQFGLGVFLAPADGTCKNACIWALNAGYRHIDTAAVYRNEEEVGQAILESGIPRSELFITTKLRRADALGYQETLERCDESLNKLGLDFVDLYLIHAPPEDLSVRKDVWRGMEKLLETGKTRAIGVSNYGPHHLEEILQYSKYGPSVNQIEIHLWLQRPYLIKATRESGAVPMAYSPLARGQKVNDEKLHSLSKKLGVTPAQIAIKWCMDKGFITIPKSSNQKRIIENLESLNIELSEETNLILQDYDEDYISGWNPTVDL
tara:strand:- start:10002 stop:10853 length:852 start_codon:yes stop_codon:yes gene_type:complete